MAIAVTDSGARANNALKEFKALTKYL